MFYMQKQCGKSAGEEMCCNDKDTVTKLYNDAMLHFFIQTHKKIGCIGLACGVELFLEVVSWSDLGRVRQSLRKVRLQSIALILLSKTNVIS